MNFLLDDGRSSDALLAEMNENLAMAYFAIGERHRKAGANEEARLAYQQSLMHKGSGSQNAFTRARLAQLGSVVDSQETNAREDR